MPIFAANFQNGSPRTQLQKKDKSSFFKASRESSIDNSNDTDDKGVDETSNKIAVKPAKSDYFFSSTPLSQRHTTTIQKSSQKQSQEPEIEEDTKETGITSNITTAVQLTQDESPIQKKEIKSQKNSEETALEIIDLLKGWTTSADSAAILQKFKGRTASEIRSIFSELKSGRHSSTKGNKMMVWLMGDLVKEDRKALLKLFIKVKVPEAINYTARTIMSHIRGYTSAHASREIVSYFLAFNNAGTTTLLTQLKKEIGGTEETTASYLFGDLSLLDANKLKDILYSKGIDPARYASIYTAQKIENLLAGFTGRSDSQAIVDNFKRTPKKELPDLLSLLNTITLKRWQQKAEVALMKDMYEADYRELTTLGLSISTYNPEKHWLEWSWDKLTGVFDYVSYVIQKGSCIIGGALWGIIWSFWDILKLVFDAAHIGIPNLVGWIMYHVSGGKLGREEYNGLNNFFLGLGKFIKAPGSAISKMLAQANKEAGLIEGPFSECKTSFYWTSRLFRGLTDVVLIFLAGYGLVKFAVSGAQKAVILARAGKWGTLIGKVVTKPFLSTWEIVKLLRPSELIKSIKDTIVNIRIAISSDGYIGSAKKMSKEFIAGEKKFWKEHKEGWSKTVATADKKVIAAEKKLEKAKEPNTTPDEAIKIVTEVKKEMTQTEAKVNNLLKDTKRRKSIETSPQKTAPKESAPVTETPDKKALTNTTPNATKTSKNTPQDTKKGMASPIENGSTITINDPKRLTHSNPIVKGDKAEWYLYDKVTGASFTLDGVTATINKGPQTILTPKSSIIEGEFPIEVSLNAPFSWTAESIRLNLKAYWQAFKKYPANLNLDLSLSNLTNFQKEYALIKHGNKSLSSQEIANRAIRKVSAGKHRIDAHYDNLKVTTNGTKNIQIKIDGQEFTYEVPKWVKVEATPTDPSKVGK